MTPRRYGSKKPSRKSVDASRLMLECACRPDTRTVEEVERDLAAKAEGRGL